MNTQLSTKLAALGIALTLNSMMIGAVAYLFSGPVYAHTIVLAHIPSTMGLFG
jgi:hypothetical protein